MDALGTACSELQAFYKRLTLLLEALKRRKGVGSQGETTPLPPRDHAMEF